MCVIAESGISGSKKAFDDLESRLSTLKGRKFYGVIQNGVYRACVEMVDGDESEKSGLQVWIIPGGKYAVSKIENWGQRLSEIGPTFQTMAGENVGDKIRPEIEFYKSQKELILMLPVK